MNQKNIVLIGFMGTGKSSVGRLLAKRLRMAWVDLDHAIEDREGRKIKDIFEKEGEPYFRKIEKEAVEHFSSKRDQVITTGGGAVLDPDNLQALKKNGILITLVASPETIYERVKNSKKRPLLNKKEDLLEEITALLEKRRPFYQKSDYYFNTDGKNASQVTRLILKVLTPNLAKDSR